MQTKLLFFFFDFLGKNFIFVGINLHLKGIYSPKLTLSILLPLKFDSLRFEFEKFTFSKFEFLHDNF